jgi:hypothetical protein
MIYSPETETWYQNQFSHHNYIIPSILFRKTTHSVRADPSLSRPTCPVLLVLALVVPALAEHWLLIFPASWGAGPSLAPFPQADPISLRSQATACFYVGHTNNQTIPFLVFNGLFLVFKWKLQKILALKGKIKYIRNYLFCMQVPSSRDGSFFSRVFNRSPVSQQNSISSSYSNSRWGRSSIQYTIPEGDRTSLSSSCSNTRWGR